MIHLRPIAPHVGFQCEIEQPDENRKTKQAGCDGQSQICDGVMVSTKVGERNKQYRPFETNTRAARRNAPAGRFCRRMIAG